jgi:hypothetical protein
MALSCTERSQLAKRIARRLTMTLATPIGSNRWALSLVQCTTALHSVRIRFQLHGCG